MNDFFDNVLWQSTFEYLDKVLPAFSFVRKSRTKWESPYTLSGERKKGKAGTFVLTPRTWQKFYIYEQNGSKKSVIDAIINSGHATDFNSAINYICSCCNLQRPTTKDASNYKKFADLKNLIEEETRTALFKDCAESVLNYMRGRGWSDEELKSEIATIGYIDAEMARRYNILAHEIDPEKYSHPDRYKEGKGNYIHPAIGKTHRLVITLISGGNIQGFKFRVTHPNSPDDEKNKYINSKGFKSGKYLDGLTAINLNGDKETNRGIIAVDGELDALHARIKGIRNVVSYAGGGVVSPQQVEEAIKKGVECITIFREIESTPEKQNITDKKTEDSLKHLAKTGLTAFIAELPQDYEGQKVDLDSYLQTHSVEELTTIINDAIPAIIWRANRLIYGKYYDQYDPKTGKFNDITHTQAHALYKDIEALSKEYINRWEIMVKLFSHVEFLFPNTHFSDAIKETAKQAKEEEAKKHQQQETARIITELSDAQKAGDFRKVHRLTDQLNAVRESGNEGSLLPLLDVTTHAQFTDAWRNREIGIDTRYKVKHPKTREDQIVSLPAGGLTYVCAPTGHGKSTFLQNLALQVASQPDEGVVLYYTFEEEKHVVITQMFSKFIGYELFYNINIGNTTDIFKEPTRENFATHLCNGDYKRPLKHYFMSGDLRFIKNNRHDYLREVEERFFSNFIDSGKIRIFDSKNEGSGIDLTDVAGFIKSVKFIADHIPVKAVFIDYVQLFHSNGQIKLRTEELKEICINIWQLAQKMQIPFILACQFNREAKSPLEMENQYISEAGDIERSANTIIQIWNTAFTPINGTKYPAEKNVWTDGKLITPIDWDRATPQYYIKVSKAREVLPGAEAILNCNLDAGIMFPNLTPKEAKRIREGEDTAPVQMSIDYGLTAPNENSLPF